MKLEAHWLSRACDGVAANGDAVVVRAEGRRTLVSVVDALGHGPAAHLAAQIAVEELRGANLGDGLEAIVTAVHERLRGSRGAAATFGLVEGASLHLIGVGNVEIRRIRGRPIAYAPVPGILGFRISRLYGCTVDLCAGDRLVAFTDGISSRLDVSRLRPLSTADACALAMADASHVRDDATILVADVEEETDRIEHG